MRRAPFREQFHGSLEMRDGGGVLAASRVDAAKAELRRRFCSAFFDERVEQAPALVELARVEQRFSELHTRGKITRGYCGCSADLQVRCVRHAQRVSEPRGGIGGTGEPLKHDAVEVEPVESARCQ